MDFVSSLIFLREGKKREKEKKKKKLREGNDVRQNINFEAGELGLLSYKNVFE